MFTNEDYERLLVKYTSQGIPAGESIQHFCDRMNVPYNLFNKWYRDTRHKVVKVKVDGMPDKTDVKGGEGSLMDALVSDCLHSRPAASTQKQYQPVAKPAPERESAGASVPEQTVSIMIDLRTSSGLRISRKGMTYPQFLDLATKLSALC